MKRYRLANFFIDTTRNLLKVPNLSKEIIQREKSSLLNWLVERYGAMGLEEKFERYLEFEPPNFCILVEYHH